MHPRLLRAIALIAFPTDQAFGVADAADKRGGATMPLCGLLLARPARRPSLRSPMFRCLIERFSAEVIRLYSDVTTMMPAGTRESVSEAMRSAVYAPERNSFCATRSLLVRAKLRAEHAESILINLRGPERR